MSWKENKENPLGCTPQGFVWEKLHQNKSAIHLDFGAHDGKMLMTLAKNGVILKGVGVDVNADAVVALHHELPQNVQLHAIKKNAELPFPPEYFDSVSIIGVIEHIAQQGRLLKQLHRVLKKDGNFLVAVPGKNLFSFLDLGNFKFVFPWLHKWYYCLVHSKQKYYKRYVECKHGLIGDIEVEKSWHQHFSHAELEKLLTENGFKVVEKDGVGFFMRLLLIFEMCIPFPFKKTIARLKMWDIKKFHSAEIFVLAKKF